MLKFGGQAAEVWQNAQKYIDQERSLRNQDDAAQTGTVGSTTTENNGIAE